MTTALGLLRTGRIDAPESLRGSLELVKRLVQSAEGEDLTSSQTRVRDGSDSLVSILGPRGAGKTTLLVAACSELERAEQAIVVPLIRPEVFEATDSLLLAVLIEIEQWLGSGELTSGRQHEQVGQQDSSLVSALSSAIRSVSISSAGAFRALGAGVESSGQYGVDATTLVRHRAGLDATLDTLFDELRRSRGVSSQHPVVIPIDDVDLSPANLEAVIAAVQLLASVRGVFPIICADRRQLEIATQAGIRRQYSGAIDDRDIELLAAQVVAKLIRPERTVSPPSLAMEDRKKFAPIGEVESLAEVLGSIASRHSLNALLWTDSDRAREFALRAMNDWLGETPRELEYLWEASVALRDAISSDEPGLLQHSLQRFVDNAIGIEREFRVAVEPGRELHTRRSKAGSPNSMILEWPNVVFGVAAKGRFTSAATTPQLRLRLRRFASVTAALFLEEHVAEREDAPRREALSPDAVSSVRALQELGISGVMGAVCDPGPTFIGEDEFEFLQTVAMNGQRTDDRFMSMPDSVGVQAIGRSAVVWNVLVKEARSANRDHRADNAQLPIRRFFQLVLEYWLHGREKAIVSRRVPSIERLMRDMSLAYLSQIADDNVSHLDDYSIDRAYCHWFERRLPLVFHELLLGPKVTEACVAHWLDAVSAGPRAVEATTELRVAFESRFSKFVDEQRRRKDGANSWVYGYHVVAEAVGTSLFADLLLFKPAYEERLRSRKVGGDLLGGSVSLTTSKGSYEFAAHPTVEGKEEMAVLREVLDQYRDR